MTNQIYALSLQKIEAEKTKLDLPDLAYDMHIAKLYALICWVKNHIKATPSAFIATVDLYSHYKSDLEIVNSIATISELSFYKEIQQALLANNIICGKAREEGKRGFTGIIYYDN
jgi:hypothetical protein